MTDAMVELESKIRALSLEEKSQLIHDLIAELDGPSDADVDEAWLEEAQRRYHDITEGRVQTVPGEKVFASLRSRLKNTTR